MPETLPVAVIGGGIAGLATAFDLEREADARGLSLGVTVFEAAPAVGGNLRTIRDGDYQLEEGPNGFLDSEPATLRLVERVGLGGALQKSEDATRHRYLLIDGKVQEMPMSPPAFLRSGTLSWPGKLRVATELLRPPRRDLGRAAEDPATDETVYDFGVRRLGREFAENFLDPMVKGVFGGDARRLSLASAFPRMVELERDHGGLFRALFKLQRERKRSGDGEASPGPSGVLHSFRGGMVELPRAVAAALRGEVQTGSPVTALRRGPQGWTVVADGREHGPFAAVVDTAPAHAAAGHLDDGELAGLLAGIPYAPMAVIVLAYPREAVDHPLSGFGMLNPTRAGRRLLGVLWSSSIFTGRAPDGSVLLRCMAGGAADPDILDLDDDALRRICLDELTPLYGLHGDPERSWIVRWPRAIAQYRPGHLARLAAVSRRLAEHPGLFLTGSSYRGIAVNHCVAEAERTAAAVLDHLGADAPAPTRRDD